LLLRLRIRDICYESLDRWLRSSFSCFRVAAARPKALPMADGQTVGKLALAAATQNLMTCREELMSNRSREAFAGCPAIARAQE